MLRIDGLHKTIAGNPILRDVNAEIPERTVALLSGPSGAGKTTLLRLIAGIDTPDAGRITWGDVEWVGSSSWCPPWRRSLSLVFQDLALWPHLTVAQHLDFILAGRKNLDRSWRRRLRAEYLDRLRIGDLAGRYPAELSGGQQQRLAIARSLVREPALLLMDEPFTQLDESLVEHVWQEISDWRNKAGGTILIVTHDARRFEDAVDATYVLRDQHLLQGGRDGHRTLRPGTLRTAEDGSRIGAVR